MTQLELREKLEEGKTLDQLLPFKIGQECLIFKATYFIAGDEIVYIPDVDLNEVPIYKPITDPEEMRRIISICYTGNDFVEECDGNADKAEELFWYCDWQHPSSAYPEICEEDE